MKVLKWLDDNLEMSLCVALMAAMTLLIFVQVIMRYVFSNSLSWSEELARYIFVWLIYLGVSFAAKQMKHVKIEAALLVFPRGWRPWVEIAGDVILLLFAAFVIHRGVAMAQFQSILKSAALGIPMSWIYAAPVAGFALTVIRQVQTILYRLRAMRKGGEREGAAS